MKATKNSRKRVPHSNNRTNWEEQILCRLPEFLLVKLGILPLREESYEALKQIAEDPGMNVPFEELLEFVRPLIMQCCSTQIGLMIALHRMSQNDPEKLLTGKEVAKRLTEET